MNRYEFTKKAQCSIGQVDNLVMTIVDGIAVSCKLEYNLTEFMTWKITEIIDEPWSPLWDKLWSTYQTAAHSNNIPVTGCRLHHTAYTRGYTSVKTYGKMAEYHGRFGNGYTVTRHAPNTNRYSIIEYWIESEDEPE